MDIVNIAKIFKVTIEELGENINKTIKCRSYFEAFIFDFESLPKKLLLKVIARWIYDYRYRIRVIYRISQIILEKDFIYSNQVYLLKQKRLMSNKQGQRVFVIFFRNLYEMFLIKRDQCRVQYYGLLHACIEQHLILKYSFNVSPFITIPKGFWEGTYRMLEVTAGTIIGSGLSIMSNVTLAPSHKGAPVIGDNVNIFRGAMIYGNVNIGDGATIGTNSVVLKDVPPGATVFGVPAKVMFQKKAC